jgi:hypothetical protein
MPNITGAVEIYANGELLLNKSGAIARGIMQTGEAPMNRNEVVGDTGIHGFVEEIVAAECEFTLTDRDDKTIDSLARITNGTVIFRRARGAGKAYTLNDAWFAQPAEVTAGEGETSILFKGTSWTEQVNTS